MAIYNIPEYRMEELEKKLAHISKKCAKYGNEFSYTKCDPFFETIKEDSLGHDFTIKLFPVNVSGTAHIDNWEFVAILEHHYNGNIIKRYNTDIEIPERFKTSPNICEHCHVKRDRLNMYVIHNTETNEWKQVGKSCLKSYTNGLSTEYVAAWMSAIELLTDAEGRLLGDIGDELSDGRCHPYYEIERILAAALAITDKYGYRKADDEPCTKNIVKSLLFNGIEQTEQLYRLDLPTENEIFSASASDTVKSIIDYYQSIENDGSEFLHNVQVILSERYCEPKNFGLLAYLPFGYKKAMEKMARERKDREDNAGYEYFGEVGKRYKNIIVTLSTLTSYETDYGVTIIYKMTDTENHVFTWKTGNYFEAGNYIAAMSVKDHKEYRGQKQTEVTRCKLESVEAAA